MTELEKMLHGQLYDAGDPELCRQRLRCQEQCYDYNALRPSQLAERQVLLDALLGHMGSSPCIEQPFWCDYGWNLRVGDSFYANHGLVVLDAGGVTFGSRVFIGPSCGFHTSGHPIDARQRGQGLEYALPIRVGSDVWFGAGVQVMPGVTIGDDVVIGSGSIVTRDIPSHCVAVGNPCRVLRSITAEDRRAPSASCHDGGAS